MNRSQKRHLERLARKKGSQMKPGQSMKVPMNVPLVGQGGAKKDEQHIKRIAMLQEVNTRLQKQNMELMTELRSMSRLSRALYESFQDLLKANNINLSKEKIADVFLSHVEKITAAIMPDEKAAVREDVDESTQQPTVDKRSEEAEIC